MSYAKRKHLAQGFNYFVGDHYRIRLFTYICAAKLCQTKQRHCYDKSINVSLYIQRNHFVKRFHNFEDISAVLYTHVI